MMGGKNLNTLDLATLLSAATEVAIEAGIKIAEYYERHKQNAGDVTIYTKDDKSPVTDADYASHKILVAGLSKITADIPIISEENKDQPDVKGGLYWTVDPLDGTKGFITKNDHFAVKVALVKDGVPVLGIIYEPASGALYQVTQDMDHALFTNGKGEVHILKPATKKLTPQKGELRTLFNSLSYNQESYQAMRQSLKSRGLDTPDIEKAKGMTKTAFYMAVARGQADIYMNCGKREDLTAGNGYSWDYAPDYLILKKAGGAMVDIITGTDPRFDQPAARMNAMIGFNKREIAAKYFPDLKA